MEENLSDANLDVDALCRKIGMSRTNLHNKLSALTGLSTTLYVRKLRLHRAQELLQTTDATVSEIAYEVGFNDPKFFSRVYTEEYGVPPSEDRRKL
ncbi:MAG: helix-turn-helix transcriptional regulator [Lewinellaceae bacterium]|nr:helix-turn-helix transcriptional regulator [Lewinellaceae bacterium]